MEKLLFALGSIAVFEGFFLAIAPGRIPKVLEVLRKFSTVELSRIGLIVMAVGVAILMMTDF
tara:strand:- start:256 stop:441 length:186 start_codon:yes stop_codon:yes gene_type:complete